MSSVTFPLTFKALGSPSLGAPVELVDRTIASLESDELLVRISYASINAMDPRMQQKNLFELPFPLVLGFDFSGTVVAVGSDSSSGGDIQLDSRVMGRTPNGGCFAEYLAIKRTRVTLQGSLPEEAACCIGIAYISGALPAMETAHFPSRSGQWLFVPGGSGGVGHFVVQLAKTCGMRVISTASKPAGLELLRSLGVDVVIDYSKQDVTAEVMAATGGEGVDISFDTVCGINLDSFKQSASLVKRGGQWMFLGPWMLFTAEVRQQTEAIVASRGATVLEGNSIQFYEDPTKRAVLERQWQLAQRNYEAGKVKPHISNVVPFEAKQLQAALDAAMKGAVGKVVVKVA